MKQFDQILFAGLGIIAGILGTIVVYSNMQPPLASPKVEIMEDSMQENTGMSMSMSDMSEDLKTKTGEEFDKAFLEFMIDHHQGAIDMAELATQSAEHKEIKELSADIIDAQTNEIEQMQQWQNDWEYEQ